MKLKSFTVLFLFAVLFANAQLNVYSGGNVGICSPTFTPYTNLQLYISSASTANHAAACFAKGADAALANYAYGIEGSDTTASSGGFATGVFGYATKSVGTSVGRHYAIYGEAGNATSGYNYGIYGSISGSNYGAAIYGSNSGDVSIPGWYAGYFNGDIRMTTDNATKTTTNTWAVSSDKRLKKNITSFTDGLNVIRRINPVTFQFTGIGGMPNSDTNIGVLAQDVQKVAKYCIGTTKLIMKQSDASAFSNDIVSSYVDTNGTQMVMVNSLTMNTHGLFYAMLNSIKQLDSTVTALKHQLDSCCNINSSQNTRSLRRIDSTSGGTSSSNNTSTLGQSAVLYQNIPNPFSQTTVITTYIPSNTNTASLMIFNMNGGLINTLPINGKETQTITINGNLLNAGMYYYTLIVDGKEIDTKKMILTQ